MPRLIMRFDLRNIRPETNAQLYRDTLELSQWADEHGFDAIQLAEHHSCDDDYIPSPLVFGGAMAARTNRVKLRFVLVLPHHNPLRLAEDLAVLDITSDGRVIAILVAGYAAHEFEMFGTDMRDRGKLMEEGVAALRSAWTGKPFAYRDRVVRITPQPIQGADLPIWIGGSTPVAARRAGRLSSRFYSNDTALWDIYREERKKHAADPGPAPDIGPGFFIVSEDPDREWERMAPYIAAEMEAYAKFGASRRLLMGDSTTESEAQAQQASRQESLKVDLAAIRAMNGYPIMTPDEAAAYIDRLGPGDEVMLHPLISGLPIEIAREHLAMLERYVLPRLRNKGN
ncbi:putative oxidoreductase [Caenibius tardaugens NBRC 16725]|uniref:Putative oxidoreductase n=1 Tax=Caenibius tardaugens NBRC 16725 TaxID=1219035 RepID=U2ZY58_9SPHN|nr:LLM class flavin-dependent oxidoreductase [Caenibius tardaugens]AZI35113.1 LLM class flavin-dependent oxidoreductase [Caenibius tardaugens NBRC 16725]GAD50304.1 putative oxidoreductase [Caenibius tardaugens NBRC 16725]